MKLVLHIPYLLLYLSTFIKGTKSTTQAGNLSSQGNEFFIGFPEHIGNADNLLLYVHTSSVNSTYFTVTSGDGMFTYTDDTSYNNPATVTVPLKYEVRGREYSWRNKGLRIISSLAPISVIAWSHRYADMMSYLALPCYDQPTNSYTYYVISTYGLSNQMSQFLIVGCTDNTSVTVIPNNNITVPVDPQSSTSIDTVIGPGQSYNFALHSLQTLFIYEPYVDLTGSKIISNKPLTIISGHEASRVPQGYSDADNIATQLIPTINWGKTFLLPPHFGRSNGQSYRIIAIHENTTAVRTCGVSTINISFDSNNTNWFFTSPGTYCSIVSDKPISVYQIGVSREYNGSTNGDPTLNTIPSMEQYDHSAIITTYSDVNVNSYCSIVIPNDEHYVTGQLKINGYNYSFSFIEIYNSNGLVIGYGFSLGCTGTFIIEHPLLAGRLFVSVYGWRTYSGYAYTGGMMLDPINVEEKHDCNPNPCQNSGFCFDGINDYICICVDGYTGKNCSINIDECHPNPCENGGTCVDGINNYTCICIAGYTGKNCSLFSSGPSTPSIILTYNSTTLKLTCTANYSNGYQWTDLSTRNIVSNDSIFYTTIGSKNKRDYQCTAYNEHSNNTAIIKGCNPTICAAKDLYLICQAYTWRNFSLPLQCTQYH